jgi:glyoxylase-like metal-dependent hydrolase (beta-lactamase superfamily II)
MFLDIIKLNGAGFASNTYVLTSGNEAAVVDPSADLNSILNAAAERKIRYILLTHGHFDHLLSLGELEDETSAEILIHKADLAMPQDPSLNASQAFGMSMSFIAPTRGLSDGEILKLGDETIRLISTPGHTPGSACYECGDMLVCGDTLFANSYGRYDLPGGDARVLFSSLKKLAEIDSEFVIHPGHGASCDLSDADIIRVLRNNNL